MSRSLHLSVLWRCRQWAAERSLVVLGLCISAYCGDVASGLLKAACESGYVLVSAHDSVMET